MSEWINPQYAQTLAAFRQTQARTRRRPVPLSRHRQDRRRSRVPAVRRDG